MKSMCDVAERLKNIGRQEGFQAGRSEGRLEGRSEGRSEERINAVKFAISLGASEEKILKQYSKEEYEKALALMKACYEQGVKTLLEEVDAKLKIIKKSGAVTCNRGCGKGFNRRKSAQHTGISFRGRDRKTGTQHAQVYPYSGILCR